MKITFCLPQPGNNPIGGYKVVYEYANRLVERGYDITIVYDCNHLYYKDKSDIKRLLKILIKYNRRKSWFILDNKVKIRYALHGLENKIIPNADCIVATAIETAKPILKLSMKKGKKIYLIQDIENWRMSNDEVNETYKMPFKKIVISDWIKRRVDQYSETPAYLIRNGLDFENLKINVPIEKRNPHTVAMLYHALEHKGSVYGLEALLRLKKEVPDLQAFVFGAPDRPENLPDWINYTQRATARQVCDIYNSAAIFMCPTINEGFGLTGAEAMACGCALVSTDYAGAREYAIENKNAILCPTKDANALCAAMKYLMENEPERLRLAYNGNTDIQKLNWKDAVDKFEDVLRE